MQRGSQQTGRIRGFGKIERVFLIHEINHPLCRGGLLHPAVQPAKFFQTFLESHQSERRILADRHFFVFHQFGIVFRAYLHHHAGIRPAGTTIGRRHSIDYHLAGTTCRRDDETAWTHTKRIDSPSAGLRHKTIFGCRQIVSSTLLTMILYLVDQHLRMFQTDADSNAFGFDRDLPVMEVAIHIPGGMTGCQDDRSQKVLARIRFDTYDFPTPDDQGIHSCLEMDLPTTADNLFADILDHARQIVRTDMRMGVRQNRSARPELAKDIQNLVNRTPFLAASVKFAVRIGTGSPFTETIVGLFVHLMLTADQSDILFTFAHVLSTFDHDRT